MHLMGAHGSDLMLLKTDEPSRDGSVELVGQTLLTAGLVQPAFVLIIFLHNNTAMFQALIGYCALVASPANVLSTLLAAL